MATGLFDFSDLAQVLDKIIDEEMARQKLKKNTERMEEMLRKYNIGEKESLQKPIFETNSNKHKDEQRHIKTFSDHELADLDSLASVYISHPYSNDKAMNIEHAEILAATLSRRYPHIMFFNPLNAMRHLEISHIPYEDCIKQCIYWMMRCDIVILADNWKQSVGCNIERNVALRYYIPVWPNVASFCNHMDRKSAA